MEEKKEEKPEAAAEKPKKSGSAKTIVLVVGICISSTLGAIFGQAAIAKMRPPQAGAQAPAAQPAKEAAEPEEATNAETMVMEPIICDIHGGQGELHHVKIGIAIEFSKPLKEEEQKKMMPRARDAAITYLRTLSYDDVTNNQNFDTLRGELNDRVAKALGKSRVGRVLFTEFVVQ